MILVDTSVWIDHFRQSETMLVQHVSRQRVLMHPMVIGELACGNLPNRVATLRCLSSLPRIKEVSQADVLAIIESKRLMGRGLGLVDAHLACSVLRGEGMFLWTRDRRLHNVAQGLGIAYDERMRR